MIDLARATRAELAVRLSARSRRSIFVWGAGVAGRAAAAGLAEHGVRIAGFIDRDPAKRGLRVEGHAVYASDHLRRCTPRPRVLIASMYWREIGVELSAMGFRAGADFEIFPEDAHGLAPVLDTVTLYAAWHHRWCLEEGIPTSRQAGGPAVRTVTLAPTHTPRMLERLIANVPDDSWVVLVDSRVERGTWRWRRGAIPPLPVAAAVAAYDVMPPPPQRRREPFVLRALARVAALPSPVLCRASVVRMYLARHRRRTISLGVLGAWVTTRHALAHCPFVGVYPIPVPAEATQRAPLPVRAVAAPGLVQFAAYVAETRSPVFAPAEVASFLPQWVDMRLDRRSAMEYLYGRASAPTGRRELRLVCHSRGNSFFSAIRDFLAATWRRAGAMVHVSDERSRPGSDSCRNVVVAPHEFFLLGGTHPAWASVEELVLVNTEQPQTRWFASCLRHLLGSTLVFDLNWQTAVLLRTLGANAHFLPLGWDEHESLGRPRRRLPAGGAFRGMSTDDRKLPALWRKRPIDVLFVGTLSSRRSQALAAAASTLSTYRCFLHLPPTAQPLVAGSPDSLNARDMADLCSRAKVVLNIHRDDLPYCEWHRVVFQAMRHGALVVSEPMMSMPVFRPGREFLTTNLEQLPAVLRRLLDSTEGSRRAARIAARGQSTLRRHFPAARVARRSLGLM